MKDKNLIMAIIIASLIIALGLYFGLSEKNSVNSGLEGSNYAKLIKAKKINGDVDTVITKEDHIIGNINSAEVFLVEYSDLECPFCKRFHDETLSELKDKFSDNDKVAFVSRHFPLDAPFSRKLHPNATEEHVIAECVAELEGDEAFFKFQDGIYEITNSDGRLPLSDAVTVAKNLGVDTGDLEECVSKPEISKKVGTQFAMGVKEGVVGTPTIFIISKKDGKHRKISPINYDSIEPIIELFLKGGDYSKIEEGAEKIEELQKSRVPQEELQKAYEVFIKERVSLFSK